uniref:Ovate family protein n=1 Tax=Panagrellus redivivus TaxID=6233 RepID=A0A7E4VC71_PANRE
MVFGWIRKLFRKKSHSITFNNVPPINENNNVTMPVSSRKKTKKHRRSKSFSCPSSASSSTSRHAIISKRLAQLAEEDKALFKTQFAVSKLPTLAEPTWHTSNPYDQNAAHFQFRFEEANDAEIYASVADTGRGFDQHYGATSALRHFPLMLNLSRIPEVNEE